MTTITVGQEQAEQDRLDAQRYRKLEEFFGGATPDQWRELHTGYPDLKTAIDDQSDN